MPPTNGYAHVDDQPSDLHSQPTTTSNGHYDSTDVTQSHDTAAYQPHSLTPERIDIEPYMPSDDTDNPAITHRRYITGICMLLCVVALWVSSGELIQLIFNAEHFSHPFFLTYFSTSLFTLYMPCYYIGQRISNRYMKPGRNAEKQQLLHANPTAYAPYGIERESVSLPLKQSLALCPLWFTLNYTYNLSLSMTSISSATILSSSSSLFVLIYSVCLLGNKFTAPNVLGVLLTVAGASMISYKDDGNADSVHGDVLAAVSAAVYGLYTVMLKYIIPPEREKSVPMLLVFGCIGLINLLTLWPLFILFNVTGIERFSLPSMTVLGALFLNGIFGTVISDYLWARSVLLTSPLIASLGLSLTIPLAMFVDVLFNAHTFTMIYMIGSVLVISGFLLVNAFHETVELVNVDQNEQAIQDIEVK